MPNITFEHPLISKNIQMDIKNLSSSGFSIALSADEDVLMPGMIIRDLKMNFSGALPIPCKVQVLYRRVEKKNLICYGFVILDMDVVAYNRLSHIVMNIIDPGAHVADEVDADHLWEFLFDSGFIYPQKYNIVQVNRQLMKQTYQRLYRDNPEITTQITYQRNGRIYGHASMIRSYRRTWMVHHLAARPLDKKRTGLQVLKNIMHYFNGLYRLPTVGMDYMMFYFRPENRFPDHFFGGFARHFKNQRACSMDLFSYLNYPTTCSRKPLPNGWLLGECTAADLEELNFFYRNTSNGLLLDVLHLDKENDDGAFLTELYARQGFI
ncbi:MAG: pilus assembly protein PilZ, partial [Deltaproteobacteria bacterium HGW-Deltaproteobacteria-12]